MVRAAGLAEAFLQRAQAAMDAHNAAFFVHAAQVQWLQVRFDLLTCVLAFLCAVRPGVSLHFMSPGLAGLALVYALDLGSALRRACADIGGPMTRLAKERAIPQEPGE